MEVETEYEADPCSETSSLAIDRQEQVSKAHLAKDL